MISKVGSDPTIAISRTQDFRLPLARWTALPLSRYGGSKKGDPIEFGFHDLISLVSLCGCFRGLLFRWPNEDLPRHEAFHL
jgi:hypothetical protein